MAHDEEQQGKAYDRTLVRRLLPYLRPYHRAILGSVLLVPLLNAFQLVQPYLVKVAIDRHIAVRDPDGLLLIALAFFLSLVFEFIAQYGNIYLLNYTGQAVVRDLRAHLFDHVLSRSSAFFDRSPVGRLLTRVTNDLEGVSEMFASGIVTLFADLFKLIGITAILLWLNWRLALATLVVAPILFVVVERIRGELRNGFREVRQRTARLNGFLAESLSGMDIVQVFGQEERIGQEYARLGAEYRDSAYSTIKYDAILYAVVEFFSSVAVAIILWYGGIRVIAGALTFGELVAFISYIRMFFEPIRDLSAKYATMQSGMASLERVFRLFDESDAITDGGTAAPVAAGRGADIRYDGVWFAYHDEEWVLKDLSFYAAPGERIALVGATGSGKSTTIKLLSRFYEPQRGSIRVDGVALAALPLQALRRRIGVVSQDVFLFSGTILDNVRLFDESIPRERVQAACEMVGLLPMLERLGRGLDDEVLERGRNFSQGQRQLLSFARVLAFDPDVLVLDEATSSVDQETEHLIQVALEKVMEGRTSLIVAHRLATIRHCDRILVFHHGELREAGSHDELIERRGLYEKLHRLQAEEV